MQLKITVTDYITRAYTVFEPTTEQLKAISNELNDFGGHQIPGFIPIDFSHLYDLFARECYGPGCRFVQNPTQPEGFGRVIETHNGQSKFRSGLIFFTLRFGENLIETQEQLQAALEAI